MQGQGSQGADGMQVADFAQGLNGPDSYGGVRLFARHQDQPAQLFGLLRRKALFRIHQIFTARFAFRFFFHQPGLFLRPAGGFHLQGQIQRRA